MTGFNSTQISQLAADLDKAHVLQRDGGNNRKLSYIEGWHAIAEANRIFGFDGWSSETVALNLVNAHTDEKNMTVCAYSARCRVTVYAGPRVLIREGCGFGNGKDRNPGQSHEKAIKEAETDARKRALMTFGNPFGLALYDKQQRNVSDNVDDGAATLAIKEAVFEPDPAPMSAYQARKNGDYERISKDMREAAASGEVVALMEVWKREWPIITKLPDGWRNHLTEEKDRLKLQLLAASEQMDLEEAVAAPPEPNISAAVDIDDMLPALPEATTELTGAAGLAGVSRGGVTSAEPDAAPPVATPSIPEVAQETFEEQLGIPPAAPVDPKIAALAKRDSTAPAGSLAAAIPTVKRDAPVRPDLTRAVPAVDPRVAALDRAKTPIATPRKTARPNMRMDHQRSMLQANEFLAQLDRLKDEKELSAWTIHSGSNHPQWHTLNLADQNSVLDVFETVRRRILKLEPLEPVSKPEPAAKLPTFGDLNRSLSEINLKDKGEGRKQLAAWLLMATNAKSGLSERLQLDLTKLYRHVQAQLEGANQSTGEVAADDEAAA